MPKDKVKLYPIGPDKNNPMFLTRDKSYYDKMEKQKKRKI